MAYTPSFVPTTHEAGIQPIGVTSTTKNHPLGTIVRGYDANLGEGEFIYLLGAASTAAGDVVSYNAYTGATTRWAGTANTGAPLAVAVTANTSSSAYGWYQLAGNAVVNCSGTVAAGDAAFFSATAQVKTAAAAGKQVLNCVAATANNATVGGSALGTGFAVYTVQRPFAQGAIT
jgi:hypothetical protein